MKSFEGFLRPETYSLPMAVGGDELVRIMAEGFKAGWQPRWTARLDSLKMSQLQLVTFASIVEGEARADDERETIAGVYHNRLRIGMALQADPTVQYAITLATGKRKPRLFTKDYQLPSPYNTYLHPGLPPGPVNSPSQRSIEASLYPAKVPYLYFVAGPDGRHVFAKTYAEHLRNIAQGAAGPVALSPGPRAGAAPAPRRNARAAACTSSPARIPDTTATPAAARVEHRAGIVRPHPTDRDARPATGHRGEARETRLVRAPCRHPPSSSSPATGRCPSSPRRLPPPLPPRTRPTRR